MVYRENSYSDCGITDVMDLNDLIAYHGCSTAQFSIDLYTQWKQQNDVGEKNGAATLGMFIPSFNVSLIILGAIVHTLFE